MADPAPKRFPRQALFGAAALVGFALLTSATARVTGIGTTQMPEAVPVESRYLLFKDRTDGAVAVFEAGTEEVVKIVPPGSNGFMRGAMRGLARERKRQDIGMKPAFRLTRWSDGRLSLEDPTTGREIHLEAFGPTNADSFAQLLTSWSERE
jgi:putative photosynthetic complex assembly protein